MRTCRLCGVEMIEGDEVCPACFAVEKPSWSALRAAHHVIMADRNSSQTEIATIIDNQANLPYLLSAIRTYQRIASQTPTKNRTDPERMTVKGLIEMLSKANPDDVVMAFDPESSKAEPITGMTYGGADGVVELFTDEP
jgi:hypothetical protein